MAENIKWASGEIDFDIVHVDSGEAGKLINEMFSSQGFKSGRADDIPPDAYQMGQLSHERSKEVGKGEIRREQAEERAAKAARVALSGTSPQRGSNMAEGERIVEVGLLLR